MESLPYAIETVNLTKRYGIFTALSRLNLRVEKSVVYGLLGPNGAGKTTLIKLLLGLLKPTEGDAYVLGERMPDKDILSEVGYMPQDTALYLNLTVRQNIELYGEIFGLSKKRITERTEELLGFINLEKWKDELVSNLSGGMKHRVSLACSMVHSPQLLLLDEPTVGIDPELRASFWDYFGLIKEKGVTILLTTHYMDEAARCDKVGLLRQGNLIAEGTPEEIIRISNTKSLEEAFLIFAKRNART